MSTDNNDDICANCGKGEEGSISMKKCGACKLEKYCSNDCQTHHSQHKKECRNRAAELHDAALFRQTPPREDCPICFLRIPSLYTGRRYETCCGKFICSGCIHANEIMRPDSHVIPICPFCRTLFPKTDEEIMERVMKRVEMGDAQAIHNLGCHYDDGTYGMPQDMDKALELWHQAGELGHAAAYCNIGNVYWYGNGVERDAKKATHYYELAAIGGSEEARYNLGCDDGNAGNMDRALKHFMIAVGGGHNDSLTQIKQLFMKGQATKDDFAKSLKAYQAYLSEIKSNDRDKAAAYSDNYKYYEL